MKQTFYLNETLAKGKALYEKPIVQVYEFEIEGDILLSTSNSLENSTTVDDIEYEDSLS